MVNIAQDEWKRRRKEREHVAHEPESAMDENESGSWIENMPGDTFAGEHARSPEQRLQDAEVQRAVEDAILELPDNERNVLVLYHQEERSYEGIAAVLGMPEQPDLGEGGRQALQNLITAVGGTIVHDHQFAIQEKSGEISDAATHLFHPLSQLADYQTALPGEIVLGQRHLPLVVESEFDGRLQQSL